MLSDMMIKAYIEHGKLVIRPLSDDTIRENGVDLRFSDTFQPLKFAVTDRVYDTQASSKEQNLYFYEPKIRSDYFDLQPEHGVLVTTKEWIEMPPDICAMINLRSTYARLLLLAPPTAINASWRGNLVIAVQAPHGYGIRLHKDERFLHVLFDELTSPVEKPYGGQGSKYQDQGSSEMGPVMDVETKRRSGRVEPGTSA